LQQPVDVCLRGSADAEAAEAYRRALALVSNDAERRFLERELARTSAG
jgi:RNA polymerase sigma-70 factor (ECF subfamily)